MSDTMNQTGLKKYCDRALEAGASHVKIIDPGSVVTAPWVRLKCQFGCASYGTRYSCPPDTPTPQEMRTVLDAYRRSMLIHMESVGTELQEKRKIRAKFIDDLTELEGEMFKDGYYKAFLLVSGPCHLCKECAKQKQEPCNFGYKARPSMESCGIDVYQTARSNGFFIQPLREKSEPQNNYCLMLVD